MIGILRSVINPKYGPRKRRGFLFRERRRAPLIPISLVIISVILLGFSLVGPIQQFTNFNPQNVTPPTLAPTSTPLPGPTPLHGGHIVYTCTRGNFNQICIIQADGRGAHQLTSTPTNSYYPALSPRGHEVVFAANKYDNFDLYMLDLNTLKVFQLTNNIGNAFSPSYSPDGEQIVFVNRAATGPPALWLIGKLGEKPHLLYAGPNNIVSTAWAPDGHTIAFAMAVSVPYAYEIFLLNVDSPNQSAHQITRGLPDIGGSISWSPDSKSLLIYAGPVGGREIYRLDVLNGATTRLTFDGTSASASYSPDGQYIVYNSMRNNQPANLYIMRSDGHSTRQLTTSPEPDWQSDWGS
jgi:Tol biopolymer transport system component